MTLLALSATVGLECVRVLFPIGYSFRERSGMTATALLVVAVFAAPVLAVPLVRRLGAGHALLVTAVMVGAARLALQWVAPIPVGLAGVAAALGLLAVTTSWFVAPIDDATRVLALVAGVALDAVVRGVLATWDLPWHDGVLANLVTVVLVGVLIGVAWRVRNSGDPRRATPAALLALGPFLALGVLFLQSPAFVASSGGVSLTVGVVAVLVGDLAAVAVLAWSRASTSASWPVTGIAGIGLALGAWWLTSATDVTVVVLVIAMQAVAVALLASAARARTASSSGLAALAAGAGSMAFGATVFLYQAHYDRPLPVSNRWLPVFAALLLGAAALRAAGVHHAVASLPRRPALLGAVAAVIGIATLGVGLGLALTAPDVTPVAAGKTLRVATYNPHETVTRDGQLDPEAMATAIERMHPDVLVVQEAGRGWPLSSGIDLVEWLQRRLDFDYVWAPSADEQFGNVVFSRVPIHDARVFEIPHSSGTMRRSAVIARVGPVDGELVTVIGTHLQNGSTPRHHQTRVEEVDALVHEWGKAPRTALLGDLNSDPGSRELRRLLAAGFTSRQDTRRCTMHTSNDNCVDWILVTPDLAQGPVHALPVDTFDHRPLVAEVALPE
jgi:endonuclease/exonuclease/phosphatase family metal-dependent hydrolase